MWVGGRGQVLTDDDVVKTKYSQVPKRGVGGRIKGSGCVWGEKFFYNSITVGWGSRLIQSIFSISLVGGGGRSFQR